MNGYLISVFCILAGGALLIRNFIYYFNDDKLRNYLQASPGGKLWVGKLGMERTAQITRKYLVPLGSIIAICLLGVGIRELYFLISAN